MEGLLVLAGNKVARGRVPAKALSKKIRKDLSKLDRKHKANQIRKQRKEAVLTEKRNLGSKDSPPHLVVVVPLHAGIALKSLLSLVNNNEDGLVHEDNQRVGVFGLVCPKFKQRWYFTQADTE
ncbi:pre-rRNA-processing protein TSR1 homolog [Bombina bombina]|uniref:pre-rRNA-processing protein TSR1 homolog n=1 Tax=Bombina bombina TaxID=8345 RepID=UPI00235B29F7|nr:pre-rRNA-processing protein TSR1 homolog [Bombina bombina]